MTHRISGKKLCFAFQLKPQDLILSYGCHWMTGVTEQGWYGKRPWGLSWEGAREHSMLGLQPWAGL